MINSCWKGKTLKKLTFSLKRRSVKRNSLGRITVFHRGGGSKGLHRRIDLKRSTSSMGIIKRIQYDPNRSSWIALVRWIEGVLCSRKRFALSKANSQKKKNAWPFLGRREKNLFFSASYFCFLPCLIKLKEKNTFSSLPFILRTQKKAATLGLFSSFLTLPRIALARAKPAFFALQSKDFRGDNTCSQSESQRWKTYSKFWAQKIERKALSWLKKKKDFFVAHKNKKNNIFSFLNPNIAKKDQRLKQAK